MPSNLMISDLDALKADSHYVYDLPHFVSSQTSFPRMALACAEENITFHLVFTHQDILRKKECMHASAHVNHPAKNNKSNCEHCDLPTAP